VACDCVRIRYLPILFFNLHIRVNPTGNSSHPAFYVFTHHNEAFVTMDIVLFTATATACIVATRFRCFINMGNKSSTPLAILLEPALNEDLETIQKLCTPSNVNDQDAAGNAAIHGAVFGGHINIVKYLVDTAGADLQITNKLGCTPLWLAAGYNHVDILDYLLQQQNCNARTCNNTGDSPLLAAVSKGHVGICRQLVQFDPSLVGVTNHNNDTPLGVAIGHGGLDISFLELLIEANKNDNGSVNHANSNKLTPLLIACERDDVTVVQWLVSKGASVDVRDATGNSPLAVAAFTGGERVVRYFINEHPTLLNVQSSSTGCSALWLAVRAGHEGCVTELLHAGADDTLVDVKEKLSPLEAAKKYKRENLIRILVARTSKGTNG
jgi:ankyrin repeat protein